MNTVTQVQALQTLRQQLNHKTIGCVTTLGNLHEGHLALCQRAQAENDLVFVTIFVNPTQFNDKSDFEKYARTIEADKKLLESVGVDYLFSPHAEEIYHDNYEVKIIETIISTELEGASRPGHFDGMLTVVNKLLNLIRPTRVYFGEKDYQQLLLVKKMVSALFMPIEVIGCPTMRANDNLALSSRNSRLSTATREKAAILPQVLMSNLSHDEMTRELETHGFKVDYIVEKWNRRLAAVYADGVRLIDNVAIERK